MKTKLPALGIHSIFRESFLSLIILLSVSAFAQPAGPNNPSQAISMPNPMGRSWTNPINVFTLNNITATAAPLNTFPNCAGSNCYYTTGLVSASYGFAIPGTATIDGIIVEISRSSVNGPNAVFDSTVKLLKAGMPVGMNKANLIAWGNSIGYQVYGSATDLWGSTWIPTDINNMNFGLYLTAQNTSPTAIPGAMVDHIRITIYYTMPVGISSSVSSDNDMINAYSPAPGVIYVNWNSGRDAKGKILLMNMIGETIYSNEITASSGTEHIRLPEIVSGIYFVRILTGDKVQTKKIFIGN